jgi:co-chaperonin GroES (HSP10)
LTTEYAYEAREFKSLTPLKDYVLVSDMEFKERFSNSGIFLPSDDGKVQGVRPRWAKVYAIGPLQTDVKVGEWVLVAHGRWTRGVKIKDAAGEHLIRRVDTNDIMFVSDERMYDETMGRPL